MASQLRVDKILPVDGAPTNGGGGIIQVVSTTKTDTFASTSTDDFIDITGMSVTITPKFSSSKILILASINLAAESSHNYGFRFMRDSTAIAIGDTSSSNQRVTAFSVAQGATANSQHFSPTFLDSPSTTSAVTYKLQCIGQGGSTGIYLNRPETTNSGPDFMRGVSTITLMEVSA